MKTIAFFNNKGGVGQTSLVYHLAWMYADLGLPVIAANLDPQSDVLLAPCRRCDLQPRCGRAGVLQELPQPGGADCAALRD
jgi:hypothetical protein